MINTIYRLFAGKDSINAVLIYLFAVILWLPSFLLPQTMVFSGSDEFMPLNALLSGLNGYNIIVSKIVAFLIFITTAAWLNYMNTRFMLIPERSFLPSFFYILIASFFPGLHNLNPLLPAAFCLLTAIHMLFSAYKTEADSYRFFDAGLLIGIGSLFYAPLIWFILFVWIAIAVMRPFYWREWLFPLLGMIVPYSLVWGYYYVFLDSGFKIIQLLIVNLYPVFDLPELDVISLLVVIYLFIILVISSFYMIKVYQFRKIYVRLYFQVFFWLFLLSLIIFFYPAGANMGMVYILALPMAYLYTNYYLGTGKALSNRLLFLMGILLLIFVKVNESFALI